MKLFKMLSVMLLLAPGILMAARDYRDYMELAGQVPVDRGTIADSLESDGTIGNVAIVEMLSNKLMNVTFDKLATQKMMSKKQALLAWLKAKPAVVVAPAAVTPPAASVDSAEAARVKALEDEVARLKAQLAVQGGTAAGAPALSSDTGTVNSEEEEARQARIKRADAFLEKESAFLKEYMIDRDSAQKKHDGAVEVLATAKRNGNSVEISAAETNLEMFAKRLKKHKDAVEFAEKKVETAKEKLKAAKEGVESEAQKQANAVMAAQAGGVNTGKTEIHPNSAPVQLTQEEEVQKQLKERLKGRFVEASEPSVATMIVVKKPADEFNLNASDRDLLEIFDKNLRAKKGSNSFKDMNNIVNNLADSYAAASDLEKAKMLTVINLGYVFGQAQDKKVNAWRGERERALDVARRALRLPATVMSYPVAVPEQVPAAPVFILSAEDEAALNEFSTALNALTIMNRPKVLKAGGLAQGLPVDYMGASLLEKAKIQTFVKWLEGKTIDDPDRKISNWKMAMLK